MTNLEVIAMLVNELERFETEKDLRLSSSLYRAMEAAASQLTDNNYAYGTDYPYWQLSAVMYE